MVRPRYSRLPFATMAGARETLRITPVPGRQPMVQMTTIDTLVVMSRGGTTVSLEAASTA